MPNPTKVFVSWSKDPSKKIAEEVKHLVEMALPGVVAWMSELDLVKGKRWSQAVAAQLSQTDIGIICCTPDNLKEPWLHFEAGALSKSVEDSAIHPVCFGVPFNMLPGALGLFQGTKYERRDILGLLHAINEASDNPQRTSDIDARFQRLWASFETVVNAEIAKARGLEEAASNSVQEAPGTDELNEDEQGIVKLLGEAGDSGGTIADIGHYLNMKEARARHFIAELEQKDYVSAFHMIGQTTYSLTKKGYAYMVAMGWA